MGYQVTAIARGNVTPDKQAIAAANPYRWRNIPGWRPDRREVMDGHPATTRGALSASGRQQRIRDFSEARAGGKAVKEAAAIVGVSLETARDYEKHRTEAAS